MARQVTGVAYGKSIYPVYDGAELGFPDHWYPVAFARRVGPRPAVLDLLGRRVALARRGDRVTARCLDEPQRSLPACVRAGLVWLYPGEGPPPPLERDTPDELAAAGVHAVGRITERTGDWRHAAENGFDEGHARYLHRNSVWMLFRRLPTWSTARVVMGEDGWLTRRRLEVGFEADYPGLGRWPRGRQFWRFYGGGAKTAIRLPGVLRVRYRDWTHYEWYVPAAPGRHRYVQLAVKPCAPMVAAVFWLRYWLYIRWTFHVDFNNQDKWMVGLMETPPEVLYRPDAAIVAWRRLCEGEGRASVAETKPSLDA